MMMALVTTPIATTPTIVMAITPIRKQQQHKNNSLIQLNYFCYWKNWFSYDLFIENVIYYLRYFFNYCYCWWLWRLFLSMSSIFKRCTNRIHTFQFRNHFKQPWMSRLMMTCLILATFLNCTGNASPSPSPPSSSSSSSSHHQHQHLSEQQKSFLLSSLNHAHNQRNLNGIPSAPKVPEKLAQKVPPSPQSVSPNQPVQERSRRRGSSFSQIPAAPKVPSKPSKPSQLLESSQKVSNPHYSGPISNVHVASSGAHAHVHHHNRRHNIGTQQQRLNNQSPDPVDESTFVHQLLPSLYAEDGHNIIAHAQNAQHRKQSIHQQVPTSNNRARSNRQTQPESQPQRQPIRTNSDDGPSQNPEEESGILDDTSSTPSVISGSDSSTESGIEQATARAIRSESELELEPEPESGPSASSSHTYSHYKLDEDEFIPEGYDKLMPPKENGNPTVVRFHVWVLGLDSIDEGSMTYVADIFMSQSWKDNRLVIPDNITFNVNASADPRGPYRLLPVTLIDKIWRPDSFFKNAKEVTFQEMTIPNHYIWLYSDRTILYMVKLSLLLSCAMKFQSYPHDTQNCTMKIESLSYTTDDLEFDWEHTEPLVVEEHIELPQHDLINQQIDYCTTNYSSGRFACVQVQFTIKRRLGYYIFHTYIPTCLIVIMSWISFWIKPEAVPARVTLCVTSLLTLSTQHAQSQKSLPPVSYIKAIDIFMSSCTVFVFASLMEYALVNILMSDEMLNGWNAVAGPVGGGVCIPSTVPPPTTNTSSNNNSHSLSSCSSKASIAANANINSPRPQNNNHNDNEYGLFTKDGATNNNNRTRFRKNASGSSFAGINSDLENRNESEQRLNRKRKPLNLLRDTRYQQSLTELKDLRSQDGATDPENAGELGNQRKPESVPDFQSVFDLTDQPDCVINRRPQYHHQQQQLTRSTNAEHCGSKIGNSLKTRNTSQSNSNSLDQTGCSSNDNICRIPSWSVIRLLGKTHRSNNPNNNHSHHHHHHATNRAHSRCGHNRSLLTNRQYPLNVRSNVKPSLLNGPTAIGAATVPPSSGLLNLNLNNPNLAYYQRNPSLPFEWDQYPWINHTTAYGTGIPTATAAAAAPGPLPSNAGPGATGVGDGGSIPSPHSHYLLQQQHHKRAYVVDNISRWIFPLSFIALNVVYWAYYLEFIQSMDDLYRDF